MSVAALSTAGFTQYIDASSNLSASQQALQTLGQSLGAGNLSGAQSAFNTYQQINQNLTNASAASAHSSASATSQLTKDTNTLGSALNSGNLANAQSAFASMQSDLATTPSQAMANATAAANQTVQWIDDMLSLSNPNSTPATAPTTTDLVNSILDNAYGLNSSTSSTNPTADILDSALGSYPAASSTSTPTPASSTTPSSTASAPAPAANTYAIYANQGNLGSGASVNAYA
jgi:hypothetical protein